MTCSCEWHRERDELIADLDRLREALEDIAANGNHPDFLAAEYAGDVLSHPGEYGSHQENDAYRERMQAAEAETPEPHTDYLDDHEHDPATGREILQNPGGDAAWHRHTSPPPETKETT